MVAQLGWKPISPVERGSAASRPLGQVGRRDASNTRQFGPRYSEIMSDNINMADQRREQRRAGAVLRSSSPASRRPPLQKAAPSTSKTSETVTKAAAAGQPSTATGPAAVQDSIDPSTVELIPESESPTRTAEAHESAEANDPLAVPAPQLQAASKTQSGEISSSDDQIGGAESSVTSPAEDSCKSKVGEAVSSIWERTDHIIDARELILRLQKSTFEPAIADAT